MKQPEYVDVDPRSLHLPSSRLSGPDPMKLHRQTARFGASAAGMPALWAYRGTDKELLLTNGVTRAYRIAKFARGTLVRVEIIGDMPRPYGHLPTIGDLLP